MKASKIKPEILFMFFALLFVIVLVFAPIILKTKSLNAVLAPHALFVVAGGTFLAGCISFSFGEIVTAFCSLRGLLCSRDENVLIYTCDDIIEMARIARARGVLALEEKVEYIENPFLKQAISALIRNEDAKTLEEDLRLLCFYTNRADFKNVEIFEELGGYAPTFGMLGAVLGLIQISALNAEPKALLSGIASAFAATVYGLGSANLIFLPCAKKLKNNLNDKLLEQEIIISSILDILNMQSSVVISEKLNRMLLENNIEGGFKRGKVIPFAA